jgi:hypothetical protein
MSGFSGASFYKAGGKAGFPHKPGHILHDVLETRMMPDLTGPVGRGTLQYTAVWKRGAAPLPTTAGQVRHHHAGAHRDGGARPCTTRI